MNTRYLELFDNGFLPGPNESKEQFFKRVKETRIVLQDPEKFIPKKFMRKGTLSPLNDASLLLSNSKGFFSDASSTTILEINKLLPIAIIKMPSKLSSYFVSCKEVLDHELVHAKRAFFPSSKYEEFIAYRTSKSFLRRYFSPLIGSTIDRILFYSAAISATLFYPFSILLLITSLLKLINKQKKISNTIAYLTSHFSSSEQMLIGLTDNEIDTFAKASLKTDPKTIITSPSFRWEFLNEIFSKDKNI